MPAKFYGLMWSGDLGAAASQAEMDRVQYSGAKYFRMEINMHQKNATGWGYYDEIFLHAAERGITVLPYLYGNSNGTPQFPTEAEYGPKGSAWETFVYEAVHRYGYSGELWAAHPSVPATPAPEWEVWNEPNLKLNNPGGTTVQPENYARFLKRTAQAVQAAQKERSGGGTSVLFAGLISVSTSKEGTNYPTMSVGEFLEKAHGVSEVGSSFTGLSLHPYSFANTVAGVEANVNEGRAQLNKYSSEKTLWITELGWPINPYGYDGSHPGVEEAQQSELLTNSFNWIASVASSKNIQALLYYNTHDINVAKWQYHAGLLRENGTARPSWCAFAAITGVTCVKPNEWHSENIAAGIVGDPAIASEGPGQMELVARGTDNIIYYKSWTLAGGWGGWGAVAGSTTAMTSGPGAISWGPNRFDVVARAPDNSTYHWWWDGSTWHWEDIAGSIASDPVLASEGPGQMELVANGTDNIPYYKSWTTGGGWGLWGAVAGTTTPMTSGPGAVSWGPNRFDVVGRAPDHSVWHWWWDGSTWHWESISASIVGDPVITSSGPGHLELVARAPTTPCTTTRGLKARAGAAGGPSVAAREKSLLRLARCLGAPGGSMWSPERPTAA